MADRDQTPNLRPAEGVFLAARSAALSAAILACSSSPSFSHARRLPGSGSPSSSFIVIPTRARPVGVKARSDAAFPRDCSNSRSRRGDGQSFGQSFG
jgi:hypothetical protein